MKKIETVLLLFFFLGTTCLYASQSAKDLDTILNALQEKMSTVKTIQTDFIQEKNLALFKQKLTLKGKIFIQKPGMLSWRVFTPLRYSLVINGSQISQWDQDTNQVQSVSLAKNPSFQTVIQQMQNWFSGTYKTMQGDYQISLISQQPLKLEFIPKEKSVAANFIQRVTVLFQDDQQYIKEINILEKSQDSTLLEFINARLNQEISPKAWEVKTDVR
ncbi:MAG: outer membrane lipoprotein carrier protein LolA [Candidatus Omnitrophica bacterium]|nr:outer membrane lipoprotein carrier protein LolA [Candidatus Omnitrophota bacterium]